VHVWPSTISLVNHPTSPPPPPAETLPLPLPTSHTHPLWESYWSPEIPPTFVSFPPLEEDLRTPFSLLFPRYRPGANFLAPLDFHFFPLLRSFSIPQSRAAFPKVKRTHFLVPCGLRRGTSQLDMCLFPPSKKVFFFFAPAFSKSK